MLRKNTALGGFCLQANIKYPPGIIADAAGAWRVFPHFFCGRLRF